MSRRFSILIIAFLTLALFASILPIAFAAPSSLTVQVRNQLSETPIMGASVVIDGPSSHSGVTDARGIVYFSNIPSGNYSITVSMESYPNSAPQMIAVNGDTTSLVLFSFTKAYFTYLPVHPKEVDSVQFNGTLSVGSSPITDYNWEFGDGTTGTGMITNHTYENPGSYTVVLTVHTEVGAAVYTQLVIVGSTAQDVPVVPWIIILVPFLIPLVLIWKRKRYYVIIQAKVPVHKRNPHCPGDGTKCEDCKVTPC